MTTCRCTSRIEVPFDGFKVEGHMIHTPRACYHASLFPDLWALRVSRETGALQAMTEQKDGAYRERDQVVALAARMARVLHWPAWLGRHIDKPGDAPWDEDWRSIVFIGLPSGQVSWHVHDSEVPLFDFLARRDDPWDGHDTAEKYRRCAAPWPWAGAPPDGEARRAEGFRAGVEAAAKYAEDNLARDLGAALGREIRALAPSPSPGDPGAKP